MARLLYFRPNPSRHAHREALQYASRLIARTAARRLEILADQGLTLIMPDGTCAICLGAGRIIRQNATWKRCPCSN